ncbi:hypothetical protein LINGRAHAP2_LOCUS24953 [Linum grandiflorum]
MAAEESDSRCAHLYSVFNGNGETPLHPKMPSLICLWTWLLLGSFAGTLALFGILLLTIPNPKWEENADLAAWVTILSMVFFVFDMFALSAWCFPRNLPRLGTAGIIVLDMTALLAGAISSTILDQIDDPNRSSDLPVTLVAMTTSIYVHIKHGFVFSDLRLRDLFLVVLVQIVVYYTWTGYRVVAIVSAVCLVVYRLVPWVWIWTWVWGNKGSKIRDGSFGDPEAQLEDSRQKDTVTLSAPQHQSATK